MGPRLQIEWQESAEELKTLYKRESHPQRRTRLQALWQLRTSKRIADGVASVGVSYRAGQQWLAWYRSGGVEQVLHHITGHASRGATPYLSAKLQRGLAARVELGDFKTVWEVVQWVEDHRRAQSRERVKKHRRKTR